jgi:hypothetical protein
MDKTIWIRNADFVLNEKSRNLTFDLSQHRAIRVVAETDGEWEGFPVSNPNVKEPLIWPKYAWTEVPARRVALARHDGDGADVVMILFYETDQYYYGNNPENVHGFVGRCQKSVWYIIDNRLDLAMTADQARAIFDFSEVESAMAALDNIRACRAEVRILDRIITRHNSQDQPLLWEGYNNTRAL